MIKVGVNILTDIVMVGELTKEEVSELARKIVVCNGSDKAAFKTEPNKVYGGIVVKAPDCSLAVCREVLVMCLPKKEMILLIDVNREIEKFMFKIIKKHLTNENTLAIIESDFTNSIDYQLN